MRAVGSGHSLVAVRSETIQKMQVLEKGPCRGGTAWSGSVSVFVFPLPRHKLEWQQAIVCLFLHARVFRNCAIGIEWLHFKASFEIQAIDMSIILQTWPGFSGDYYYWHLNTCTWDILTIMVKNKTKKTCSACWFYLLSVCQKFPDGMAKSADCDQGLHSLLKHLCPLVSDNYLRNRLIWVNIIRYHLLFIDTAEIYTIAHAENLYNCNSWTVACNRLQHRAPDINGCFWLFFLRYM